MERDYLAELASIFVEVEGPGFRGSFLHGQPHGVFTSWDPVHGPHVTLWERGELVAVLTLPMERADRLDPSANLLWNDAI